MIFIWRREKENGQLCINSIVGCAAHSTWTGHRGGSLNLCLVYVTTSGVQPMNISMFSRPTSLLPVQLRRMYGVVSLRWFWTRVSHRLLRLRHKQSVAAYIHIYYRIRWKRRKTGMPGNQEPEINFVAVQKLTDGQEIREVNSISLHLDWLISTSCEAFSYAPISTETVILL